MSAPTTTWLSGEVEAELSTWPNTEQAAAQLGVSVRKIERMVASGELEPRRRPRPGGGRAENVFDPARIRELCRKPARPAEVLAPAAAAPIPPKPPSNTATPGPTGGNGGIAALEPAPAALAALIQSTAQAVVGEMLAQQPPPDPMFVKLSRACEITGLSRGALRRIHEARGIRIFKDGRRILLGRDELPDMDLTAIELPAAPAKPRKKKAAARKQRGRR